LIIIKSLLYLLHSLTKLLLGSSGVKTIGAK